MNDMRRVCEEVKALLVASKLVETNQQGAVTSQYPSFAERAYRFLNSPDPQPQDIENALAQLEVARTSINTAALLKKNPLDLEELLAAAPDSLNRSIEVLKQFLGKLP